MNGFSNENIKDKLCGGCDCSDFSAGMTYSYNSGTNNITLTDTTTYGTGNSRKIVQLHVYDKNGNKVIGSIAANDGDNAVTLSLANLDKSGGFRVDATVVSNSGCISDGHADFVGITTTSGSLGYWDKDNDAITIGTSDDES